MFVEVEWDTYDEDTDSSPSPRSCGLPKIVEIPPDVVADFLIGFPTQDAIAEDVSDWLSDTYGYCVIDWTMI